MRVTLKDIARRCKVTPTLVSAVLNRKTGGIRCSQAKQDLIRSTAQEMGYHPNLLARSMANGQSPVVGVMLSTATIETAAEKHPYFDTVFFTLTTLLNQRGLEVLFVPFRTEEEQIQRLAHLAGDGIVGSVVTNLIPHHISGITRKLQQLNMPYMILGNPGETDCHCVYSVSRFPWRGNYEKNHGIAKTVFITAVEGELRSYALPFPDDYMWLAEPLTLTKEELLATDTLFLCAGLSILEKLPVRPEHLILMELPDKAPLIPPELPAVLSGSSTYEQRLQHAADHLSNWLRSGHEPLPRRNRLTGSGSARFLHFQEADQPFNQISKTEG